MIGAWAVIGLGILLVVALVISMGKNHVDTPPLGAVEIVEIDGKYAVRHFGYYAGYGKPMQIDIDKGKEPFGSGWFCWQNRYGVKEPITFDKEPEWSYVDEHGYSTGIFGGADAPEKRCVWSYEYAEQVAQITKYHTECQQKELDTQRKRMLETDEWFEKGKNAKSVKRL